MPGVTYDIQALGFDRAAGKLKRVSYHLRDVRPAWKVIAEMLEQGEARLFRRYRGKYVDTGATRASLTQPTANDAIREFHAQQMDFGTAVWYAHFHRDKKGKSILLKLQPTERKVIPTTLLQYVVAGFEGAFRR